MTTQNVVPRILAGAVAAFVGIGLARFAYNPLFPAMVEAGWVAPAGGAYLGSFNFIGFLIGVLGSLHIARHVGVPHALDFSMGLTALSFLACAIDLGLFWFCFWRCLAGISGGVLLVLAGPAVQAIAPPAYRGLAGGVVMSGVGAGIMFGAFAIPLLVEQSGPSLAWFSLAALVMALWGFTFRLWPAAMLSQAGLGQNSARIWRLTLVYGISAAGMVPHMVYLSDLIIRDRGFAVSIASSAWGLFGLGAVAGTMAGGRVLDWLGGQNAISLWLIIQLLGLSLLMIPASWANILSGFVGGFAGVGLTAVILGYSRKLNIGNASGSWRLVTTGSGIFQAVGAIGLAVFFDRTQSHSGVVIIGWFLTALALAVMCLPKLGKQS